MSMLGRQGLEEGEPGGRRQREMGTKRQVIETRMRWAGREGVRIRSGGAGGKGKEEGGPEGAAPGEAAGCSRLSAPAPLPDGPRSGFSGPPTPGPLWLTRWGNRGWEWLKVTKETVGPAHDLTRHC